MGRGIACLQPVRSAEAVEDLAGYGPDVIVVVAYGQRLPEAMIESVDVAINVHFSLLPQLRGPAPVVRALEWGFRVTGVTVQRLAAEIDAGEILAQRRVPVRARDDAASLTARLVRCGRELLRQVLGRYRDRAVEGERQQLAAGVTYAPRVEKGEAALRLVEPGRLAAAKVRAFGPRPGAYCVDGGRRLKILAAVATLANHAEPVSGSVVSETARGPLVAWGRQRVLVETIQREGGRPVTGRAIIDGRLLVRGHRLEQAEE